MCVGSVGVWEASPSLRCRPPDERSHDERSQDERSQNERSPDERSQDERSPDERSPALLKLSELLPFKLEPPNDNVSVLEALFHILETTGLWLHPRCPSPLGHLLMTSLSRR